MEGQKLCEEVVNSSKDKNLLEKHQIIQEAKADLEKYEKKLITTLVSAPKYLSKVNKQLLKRLYEIDRMKKKKNDQVKISGSNLNKSWESCLNEVDGPKRRQGIVFLLEDFVKVKQYTDSSIQEGRETFTVNELRIYLDRPKSENSGIVLLVTENFGCDGDKQREECLDGCQGIPHEPTKDAGAF